MANNGNIITAPVVMPTDIAAVLHISGTDLATTCQSSAINKWAKFKPFRCNRFDIVPVVDSNGFPIRQTAIGSHYRYLTEANCGLYVNYRNYGRDACISKCQSMMTAGNDDDIWQYQPPTGGSSQPFRLVDFCGYRADALPFLWQSNLEKKQVLYRGSEDYDKGVNFTIEVYDSNNETIEGMIEASDLKDGLYNGDNLYYYVAICHPSTFAVLAASVVSQPISNVDGRAVSFSIRSNANGYSIIGNVSSSPYSGITKYKVVHMLGRMVDGEIASWLPIPYNSNYPPITSLELQTVRTSIEFDMIGLANFVSNGSAISGLTFQSLSDDISINNWNGVTVKMNFLNTSSNSITINLGEVYCQTNCHSVPVTTTSIYDLSYQSIGRFITLPPKPSGSDYSSTFAYLTFANVFDFDSNNYIAINNADVEISFWGVDGNDNPTINVQTWGNDGTIIYHT